MPPKGEIAIPKRKNTSSPFDVNGLGNEVPFGVVHALAVSRLPKADYLWLRPGHKFALDGKRQRGHSERIGAHGQEVNPVLKIVHLTTSESRSPEEYIQLHKFYASAQKIGNGTTLTT